MKKENKENSYAKVELNNSKIARARNNGRWKGRGGDWATPIELYEELDKEFNFTIDVCASNWNAKNKNYWTIEDNALMQDWSGEVCFMNPPYGKDLKLWIKKAYYESLRGAVVVCLVPASTDLAWWHDYAMKGEIRFIRGRPRFITPEGKWQNAFTPSVIIIFRNPEVSGR